MATASDAQLKEGVPLKPNTSSKEGDAHTSTAHDGDATAAGSDAKADGSTKTSDQKEFDEWASPGVALKTISDTRIHLLEHHDILLKDRYTQKLVKEYLKLDGRRSPRDGGGAEVLIKVPSIDAYANEIKRLALDKTGDPNDHDKHASKSALDPDDKIFSDLLAIARTKPYMIPIEGDALPTTASPIETPSTATQTTSEAQPSKDEPVKPIALQTPTATPTNAVPREMFDLVKEHSNEYKTRLTEAELKRDQAIEARDSDREDHTATLSKLQTDHAEQYADLVDDLTVSWREIFKLKDANSNLLAAYTEARALLPADVQLKTQLTEATKPNTVEIVPIKPPQFFTPKQTEDYRSSQHRSQPDQTPKF